MPTSTGILDWSIELTPCDRDDSFKTVISRADAASVNIASVKWDAQDKITASVVEVRFPSIEHFYNAWDITNAFAHGSLLVLKVEGVVRFTGIIQDFTPVYSAEDRSCVVTAYDKMKATQDAIVEINRKRRVITEIVQLTRRTGSQTAYGVCDAGGNATHLIDSDATFSSVPPLVHVGDIVTLTSGAHIGSTGTVTTITDNTHIITTTLTGGATFATGITYTINESSFIWSSAAGTYPWAERYLIPVWIKNPAAGKSYRVLASEYQAIYTLGAIYFQFSAVKVLGDDATVDSDADGGVMLDDYETEIYAKIAYYDITDTSTSIANLLTEIFEYDSDDGGLGWVNGVDFTLDPTPVDVLNELDKHTKQGDSDVQTLISDLYDNPRYQFPENYWIRDFAGTGFIRGKFVYQQSGLVWNGDFGINPADIPAGNWILESGWVYNGGNTRADKTSNGTGAVYQNIYADLGETYRVTFTVSNYSSGTLTPALGGTNGTAVNANGTYIQYITCGATSGHPFTKTFGFVPSNSARLSVEDVSVSIIPKDISVIYNASFPSSLSHLYTRAILVNNASSAKNLSRDTAPVDLFTAVHFSFGGKTYEATVTSDPTYTGHASGPATLVDGRAASSYGYFMINKKKAGFTIDVPLPQDKPLFRIDLGLDSNGNMLDIDRIIYCCMWTFNHGPKDVEDDSGGQPWLYNGSSSNLPTAWGAYALSLIYEPQRITVEANTSATATPDVNGWYAIHPDLFMAVSTPGAGNMAWTNKESWHSIENIGTKTRHLRVVIDNPLYGKCGENNENDAYRIMLWFMTEFQVYSKNRLLDAQTGDLPEVRFVDDPSSELRYRFGMDNTIVDMYRPTLLAKLNCYTNDATPLQIGLKGKTIIIDNNELFDFVQKTAVDPEDVSIGFKYLVTRLDAASRENEWAVNIDPRPDILIGDVVFDSKLNTNRLFLVHGSTLNLTPTNAMQFVTLSDHDYSGEK